MGCDIHMFPEKKEDWGWRFIYRYVPGKYTRPDTFPRPDRDNYFAWDDRWYWLFGQLAGVRRPGPPISEPRGVPGDASEDAKRSIEEWGTDFHSHSWLTLAELLANPWEQRHDGTVGPQDIETIKEWLKRLAEIDSDPEKVRIVFAFDN